MWEFVVDKETLYQIYRFSAVGIIPPIFHTHSFIYLSWTLCNLSIYECREISHFKGGTTSEINRAVILSPHSVTFPTLDSSFMLKL